MATVHRCRPLGRCKHTQALPLGWGGVRPASLWTAWGVGRDLVGGHGGVDDPSGEEEDDEEGDEEAVEGVLVGLEVTLAGPELRGEGGGRAEGPEQERERGRQGRTPRLWRGS